MKKMKIDIREMGLNFFVPIITILFFIIFIKLNSFNEIQLVIFFEFIVTPMASWWSIFLFYLYFNNKAYELLFSTSYTNAEHGIIRILKFFMLHCIIMAITIICIFPLSSLSSYFINFLPISLFFSSLAFFLIVTTRNAEISVSIISIYVVVEVLTSGSIGQGIHVFSFGIISHNPLDIFNGKLYLITYSIILMYLGHRFLGIDMNHLFRNVKKFQCRYLKGYYIKKHSRN
jgi:hypothetical protein